MKAIFKIFPERKLILAGFTGTIDYREVLQWFDEVRAHPDFSQKLPGLLDLRKEPGGQAILTKFKSVRENFKYFVHQRSQNML